MKENKITQWQKRTVAFGLQGLGKAFSSRDDYDFIEGVRTALKCLNEFIHDINPAPEINKKEAVLSAALHTFTRKYMDSEFSCVLHGFIKENRGKAVWYNFIKELDKSKSIKKSLNMAEIAYRQDETLDSLTMYMLLVEWDKNYNLEDPVIEAYSPKVITSATSKA